MAKARNYTEEFKREAVNLANQSGKVRRTAKDLGIPEATLQSWRAKSISESEDPVSTKNMVNEIRELRKKLAIAEQEKAILKKAMGYLAKEPG